MMEAPRKALQALQRSRFEAIVSDLPREKDALAFLWEAQRRSPGLPAVALVEAGEWIEPKVCHAGEAHFSANTEDLIWFIGVGRRPC